MPLPLPKNQIDKLGERLRNADEVGDEDLALLQALLQAHNEALSEVATRLTIIGLHPTTRPKTTESIIDKLRRQSRMRLSQVQDLAGARVVQPMTLTQQNQVGERIKQMWPEAGVSDRRADPSSGYRALHLVPQVGGCHVEIQVRTVYQDAWAQMAEIMGDRWGRDLRYGGLPDDPDTPAVENYTRRQVVGFWIDYYSPQIAELERQEDYLDLLADTLGEQERTEIENQIEADYGAMRRFLNEVHGSFGLG